VQERLLATKRENPRRSLHMLQQLLEDEGIVPRGALSRSAIHRFLQRHGLSVPWVPTANPRNDAASSPNTLIKSGSGM